MELGHTVCALLGWRRSSGRLKGRGCGECLEHLEAEGLLLLRSKQSGRPVGAKPSAVGPRPRPCWSTRW